MRNACPLLVVALALLTLAFAGCARFKDSADSGKVSADAVFAHQAQDCIQEYLQWRPQIGTSLGLHEYDGRITDFSAASIKAELARLKKCERELSAVSPKSLSPLASRDLRWLQHRLRRERFSFEEAQIYTRNPMTYAGALDVNIYIQRDFAPLPDRVKSVIAILRQASNIVSAAQANLEKNLSKPLVETAIEQAQGTADFLGKDLAGALKDKLEANQQAEFNAANQAAITALRGYAQWLRNERLPNANAPFALGPRKYAQLLEAGEMLNISPERILEVGMVELRKKQAVFAEAAKIVDPTRPPHEVFKAIQADHPTAENLIPDTAKNLELIRKFVLEEKLVTIPSDVRATVAETPQFMRATSFASMDTPGPFEEKATQAFYYVTPVEPEWSPRQKDEWLSAFNYYTTDVVSIHEAYPGHYVQFLCLNASPATRLEKIFTSYAFVEGWAHYSEQMVVDSGFEGRHDGATADPVRAAKYRLAQTDEALLRLCRLCVSVRMHCQGMTVDEATKFFVENCYYEEKPARQEAVRGTFDPEFLYYTVGKLAILKLREDYRRQEGAHFSLQKFHDELLRHGAPPMRLMREVMLKDSASWSQVL